MDFSPLRLIECSVLFEDLVEQYPVHLIIAHAVRSRFIIPVPILHPTWQLALQVNESTVVGVRLLKPSLIFIQDLALHAANLLHSFLNYTRRKHESPIQVPRTRSTFHLHERPSVDRHRNARQPTLRD